MPRGKNLSEFEKGQIQALKEHGMTNTAIAERLKRSRCVIANYLRNPETYGTTKRSGRPPKVTERELRLICRTAKSGITSARKLRDEHSIPLSVRRVREILHDHPEMVFTKRKPTPHLKKEHKQARLEWAIEKIKWGPEQWMRCVFSDEKRFNLDGPDGFQCYWHSIRADTELYSRRRFGGGGVMVWGAISAHGKSELAFLEGKQDSDKYIWTLSEYLLPFVDKEFGRDCIFQQDGASIHTSTTTKSFLEDQQVEIMEWPSLSPDLNIIENVWGVLARAVYDGGRQFETKESLIATIRAEWAKIDPNLLAKLFESLERRCTSVIELKGGKTKY